MVSSFGKKDVMQRMDPEQNKEKLWRKDYIIIMFATSGISFSNYFYNTTLPIYAQTSAAHAAYAGLLIAAYTLRACRASP
jgi:hypothetical protein